MRLPSSAFLLATSAVLSGSYAAEANTISGTVFCNVSNSDASNTPLPGAAVSGSVCATFTSNSINFNANSGNTLGSFLNSGSLQGAINYQNGFTSTANLDYSVFQFTGLAYFVNGQTYSATHDDGTVMQVDGLTVINSPGPTSSRTDSFTFTEATGAYNFAYNFSEVQGASVYSTNATNSPVPEPSTLVFLGTGVLGGAEMLRRHRFSSRVRHQPSQG